MSIVALKARIQVLRGSNAGQVYELSADDTTLGRHSECGIVLPDQTISRQHAHIVRRADGYYVEDLQSLNGTFVNGQRVERPLRLESGDRIQIHDVLLGFYQNGGESTQATWCEEAVADDPELESPH